MESVDFRNEKPIAESFSCISTQMRYYISAGFPLLEINGQIVFQATN